MDLFRPGAKDVGKGWCQGRTKTVTLGRSKTVPPGWCVTAAAWPVGGGSRLDGGAGGGVCGTLIGIRALRRWRRCKGVLPAALEPVTPTVHLHDVHVVGETIQQRAGEPFRPEDLGPLVECPPGAGRLVVTRVDPRS